MWTRILLISITKNRCNTSTKDIEKRWKLDMSFISNKNQATKRFDFVIKTDKCIYGIETNDNMEHIYNISDMKNGVIQNVII